MRGTAMRALFVPRERYELRQEVACPRNGVKIPRREKASPVIDGKTASRGAIALHLHSAWSSTQRFFLNAETADA